MSVYEQIKADLGYLKLDAAAGAFATLAEEAKTEDWSHIEFLARLVAEQATADRDRRLVSCQADHVTNSVLVTLAHPGPVGRGEVEWNRL